MKAVETPAEYQVVAVDDGTSNEHAGEVLTPPAHWDVEFCSRWRRAMERMERLGWVERI